MKILPTTILLFAFATHGVTAAPESVELPAPRVNSGKPLMQALQARRSTRQFSSKPLPRQVLGDLLWAAFGVNRESTGGRTAPSAFGHQEIDLYVFTADGVFLYDARNHALDLVNGEDLRADTGSADYARNATVSLLYVADYARTPKARIWEKEKLSYADTGFIGQNVYLYCASEGLATVIHDNTSKGTMAGKLGLRPDQQIILTQSIGYPAE